MPGNESVVTSAAIARSYVRTSLPYDQVVAAFEGAVGHFDPEAAADLARRGAPWSEFEATMTRAAGPSGLMILGKFDQGAVASLAGTPIRCRLYLVGNPAIAAEIVRIDARACLYVPFRVAIYVEDGARGATISFDQPSSSLGVFQRDELRAIGLRLDQKLDAVLEVVRQGTVSDRDAA